MRALIGLALAIAALLAPVATPDAAAADPVFGEPTIESTFGEGIVISQPVTFDERPARIELLLTYADAAAPIVVESRVEGGIEVLQYTVRPDEGHILPNTPIEARFRITPADGGPPVFGPSVTEVYDDDRFEWQTVAGDVVRVHWYEGGRAFAERALEIGEEAVRETAELLGVTEDEPVDFFIYADQDAFYDALGPGTRENVGGQANAEIRTLFALIEPSAIDDPWVGVVVPHELVHLVFDTAVQNPYHFPPRWLNEGLAVYLSQGYDASDRGVVESAAGNGTLIPLDGLAGQFPTSAQRFFQAYSESVSAVEFLIRTHGEDALVSLIGSYADGLTDDEAFTAAIGMDVAAFDAAWMEDLDARIPERHGPQPAPEGPEPAAWVTASDAPGPTPAAGTSASPGASAGTGAPGAPTSGGGSSTGILVGIAAVAAVGVLIAIWFARRRRASETAA